jgi:hypothetical protein
MAFSAIIKPSDYFTPELYVGTGSSRTISTLNFQPDWVWIKNRDTTDRHSLFDVVRAAPNMLSTNNNDAQSAQASELTAFNTNGFTVNTATSVNGSSANYVSWNWKANGAGSSNTDGSITSTVSVNTTSGFSIVKYTGNGLAGATIGHGLGAVPKMTIIKSMTAGEDWIIPPLNDPTNYIVLNSTGAEGNGIGPFNNTAATSSVFSVGTWGTTNGNSQTLLAYCFAEKQGFSKISSYIGNGNADGTFNYTGFKPAWVMIKNLTSAGSNWRIFDNQRLGYNVNNATLYANLTNAEADETSLDLLSNGFKMRGTTNDLNGSGQTYIYMAFAETPFVANSGESIPTTAR